MEPTSHSGPKKAPETRSEIPADEYLARQVEAARLALSATLDDLSLDVAKMTDLRRWVRRYPWPAVGTALADGFTAAHVVMSRRNERDGAVDSPAGNGTDSEAVDSPARAATSDGGRQKKSAQGGEWRSKLVDSLFDILRLAVTQFVAASFRQAARDTTNDSSTAADGAEFASQGSEEPLGGYGV